jgi:HD-GYP domain-containing protein (c-di-GMP phosphodiesterase class II)
VAERGVPAIVNDVRSDPRFCGDVDELSGFLTTSLICVPLKSKGSVVGVLEALNKRSGPFVTEDLDVLEILANQVAVALENARLYEDVGEMFGAVIEALLETVEKRDTYTRGHTRRVTGHSVAIGQGLGLARTDMENLRLAAMLHDIGKIGISDRVLQKDGALTQEEFEAIRCHPVYGAEILQHIRKLHSVLPGVRHHHERYNGTGYPGGLKGSDIPVIARIIAVADTFDAMVTDRPYRKGLTARAAFEELRRQRGIQFDPAVVGVFLESFRSLSRDL